MCTHTPTHTCARVRADTHSDTHTYTHTVSRSVFLSLSLHCLCRCLYRPASQSLRESNGAAVSSPAQLPVHRLHRGDPSSSSSPLALPARSRLGCACAPPAGRAVAGAYGPWRARTTLGRVGLHVANIWGRPRRTDPHALGAPPTRARYSCTHRAAGGPWRRGVQRVRPSRSGGAPACTRARIPSCSGAV